MPTIFNIDCTNNNLYTLFGKLTAHICKNVTLSGKNEKKHLEKAGDKTEAKTLAPPTEQKTLLKYIKDQSMIDLLH